MEQFESIVVFETDDSGHFTKPDGTVVEFAVKSERPLKKRYVGLPRDVRSSGELGRFQF